MFNDMRSELRNLLLVASELGGEATQYVKVLRMEKERLLPLDAIQTEMEELRAQVEQASTAEANMFKALTKANDRVQVAEKNAASCKGLLELTREKLATLQVAHKEAVDDKHAAQSSEEKMFKQLEQANADICKARAAEASMLRSLKMANNTIYEAREEAGELKGKLELTQKQIATLQVTNDEYKEQLTRQAKELELMQTNRVHAEVYQNVAAERDRALAELRTQEQAFQKELNKQHANLCACQVALVREQGCRAELAKELQGCIADERANLATTRKERDKYGDEVLRTRKELEVVSNKYDQLRVAFNKSGEEVMRLHLERVSMLREQDNAQAVIKSVEIGEAAARKELGEAMKLIEVLKGQVEDAESTRDSYNEQLAGWYKWLKEASKEAGIPGVARNFYDRDNLLEAIRSLRKDPSAVRLALKKAEDKLFRVAAALDAPVRSSTFIDYPGVDIVIAAVRAPIREAMKDE